MTRDDSSAIIAVAGQHGIGVELKWLLLLPVLAIVCAIALPLSHASAAERDPLISPATGGAGSLFQVVGQSGWTPGETITLSLTFADTDPGAVFPGPAYHERPVPVLRDGTWSFPIVVNQEILPFPLWRPGFIVVRAQSATKTAVNSFVYTVEGRSPIGTPPLADLGSGPQSASTVLVTTLALFAAGAGAMVIASGAVRRSVSARSARQHAGEHPHE